MQCTQKAKNTKYNTITHKKEKPREKRNETHETKYMKCNEKPHNHITVALQHYI